MRITIDITDTDSDVGRHPSVVAHAQPTTGSDQAGEPINGGPAPSVNTPAGQPPTLTASALSLPASGTNSSAPLSGGPAPTFTGATTAATQTAAADASLNAGPAPAGPPD